MWKNQSKGASLQEKPSEHHVSRWNLKPGRNGGNWIFPASLRFCLREPSSCGCDLLLFFILFQGFGIYIYLQRIHLPAFRFPGNNDNMLWPFSTSTSVSCVSYHCIFFLFLLPTQEPSRCNIAQYLSATFPHSCEQWRRGCSEEQSLAVASPPSMAEDH